MLFDLNSKGSARRALMLGVGSAVFVLAAVGCKGEQAGEANVNSQVVEETAIEKAKGKRRVDTGAEIANEALVASAGQTVYEFDVVGMTCAGCANSINDGAKELPGVTKVRISLVQNKAWVLVSAADGATSDEIGAAIQDAGDYAAELVVSEQAEVAGDDG